MTTKIDNCDLSKQNTIQETELVEIQIGAISNELKLLDKDSNLSSLRVKNLKSCVGKLKDDIQAVMCRIEQNVEMFRKILSDKLKTVLDTLSDKNLQLQLTLEECYKVMGDLVEIFLKIGYELENDITNLSENVDKLNKEMKTMAETIPFAIAELDFDCSKPHWFINDENKLTLRKNIPVGAVLPKFKCGSNIEREQFLNFMTQAFNYYRIPETIWVTLTTKQLIESARDWWFQIDDKTSIVWTRFTQLFMNASFDSSDDEENFDYNASVQAFNTNNKQLRIMKCKEIAKTPLVIGINIDHGNKAEEICTANLHHADFNSKINEDQVQFIKNISLLNESKLVYNNEDAAHNANSKTEEIE